ncbi:MAG: VanZ like family protein [Elusimicrobia bacterium ADurb.Bin231]|nr:MAG: VanZ like family protein [Elusimicrobia bacterium ADurb.Bin231]
MKFLKPWLPVFLWCFLIFFLSSIPGLKTSLGFGDLVLRKIAHMTEYFVLTLLLYRALKKSFYMPAQRILFIAMLLSFVYALSDEYHQSFVPNRSGNIIDVLIDSTGILFAYILYREFSAVNEKDVFPSGEYEINNIRNKQKF